MNGAPSPAEHLDPELERLVAYLDGELETDATREVERRLSQDAGYRQRLHQLQQSWDLLEHLPNAQVDPLFTQSTVAMVAVQATNDVDQLRATRSRLRVLATIGGGLAATVAFVLSYAGTSWYGGRDNRRLLHDLPVIQKLDEYRYAETIEFLRMLDREGLFAEDEVSDVL
jgi:anti-sigma factor RsiW